MGEQRKSFGLGGIVRWVRLSSFFLGLVMMPKVGVGVLRRHAKLGQKRVREIVGKLVLTHSYAFVLYSAKCG